MITEKNTSSIAEIHNKLKKGDMRIDENINIYRRKIEKFDSIINAFISSKEGKIGVFDPDKPLSGVPIAIKDLIDVEGIPTTAGAEFYRNNIPLENSTVVKKILDSGGYIIGKTNMHEIALGVTNINPHYGNCKNPWNQNYITGGSSGGSAAAVISGMCVAALGSDTGGSIRIPSSLCGTVGLKPTYGLVSLNGVMPLSWNLDHVGPITNCVRDSAVLLQIIAGYDDSDPASVDFPVDDYISHLDKGIKGLRILMAIGDYIQESEIQTLKAVQAAADVFRSLGAEVMKMEIPSLRKAAMANGIITTSDAAAIYQERIETSPGVFGEDVLKRLLAGRSNTSSQYSNARRVQMVVRRDFQQLFRNYDLLILPTTPSAAPMLEGSDAIEQARKLTRFTAPFNLAGLPAISIPCGFTNEGLPIGLQLVGNYWNEKTLLKAANAYEKSTRWMDNHKITGLV
jgi:aspartyl-tRNA(Asn)/glutamyl-tRNA(Gln) amidotransferase subunit A